jgi:hypothetical protein
MSTQTVAVVLGYTVTTKSSGAPVPNQTVQFSYEAAGATSPTSAGSSTTDANGYATVTVQLAPGQYTFFATSHDPTGTYADSSAQIGPVPVEIPTSGKLVVVSIS